MLEGALIRWYWWSWGRWASAMTVAITVTITVAIMAALMAAAMAAAMFFATPIHTAVTVATIRNSAVMMVHITVTITVAIMAALMVAAMFFATPIHTVVIVATIGDSAITFPDAIPDEPAPKRNVAVIRATIPPSSKQVDSQKAKDHQGTNKTHDGHCNFYSLRAAF